MPTKPSARTTGLRVAVLAVVAALLAGVMAMLACAPAAPSGQSEAPEAIPTIPYLGTPPTEEEQATWRARPKPTPYPPGYVKPTDPPTFTPVPTVVWETDAPTPQLSSGGASVLSENVVPESQLLGEVRDFIDNYEHDAAARIKVLSSREVHITVDVLDGTTLESEAKWFTDWTRDTAETVEIYSGSLPAQFDIASSKVVQPTVNLDVGREYVVFVVEKFVREEDYPAKDKRRVRLNQAELNSFGGEGYLAYWHSMWVVDGPNAWQVPRKHLVHDTQSTESHWNVARQSGRRLALSKLKAAITQPATVSAQAAPTPTPTLPQRVSEQLRAYADGSKYDAVARLRVLSNTDYRIQYESVEWPDKHPLHPVFFDWRRSRVQVVETYHGTLPNQFDMVNDVYPENPNQSLETGQEYVLFVEKRWLLDTEHPGDERRRHYNQEQLDALGGPGYVYNAYLTLIIDGSVARIVPLEHLHNGPEDVPHVEAARQANESITLADLETLIRASDGRKTPQ